MTNDCWLFAGYVDPQGYGRHFYTFNGKTTYIYAHRLMYEQLVGEIPKGLVIDHLCRVRHCVNPAHLEPVTASINTLRGEGVMANKRKTHCYKGHEFTEWNTQYRKSGWRVCRTCNRERLAKQRQATHHTL